MAMQLERWQEAERHLEAILARRPQDAAAHFYLARLLAAVPDPEVRRPGRALELATRLAETAGTPSNLAPSPWPMQPWASSAWRLSGSNGPSKWRGGAAVSRNRT